MLTLEKAYKIVEENFEQFVNYPKKKLEIRKELTVELEYGWLINWGIKNPGKMDFIVGVGPVIFNKFTGKFKATGSLYPYMEYWIDDYEESMNGYRNIWTIRLKNKVGFIRYFKALQIEPSSIGYYIEMLNSYPNIIKEGNIKKILPIKYKLENVGIETIMTNINAKNYDKQRPWIDDIAKFYYR